VKFLTISLALLLASSLAGCGPPQEPPGISPTQHPASSIQPRNIPAPALPLLTNDLPQRNESESAGARSTPAFEDQFINLAKQDLAQRLNVDIGQIMLVKTTDLTWSDISSGCNPVPGQILTQGSATGYQIWLEASGQEYIYHAALDGRLILCQNIDTGANNPLLSKTPGIPPPPPPVTNP